MSGPGSAGCPPAPEEEAAAAPESPGGLKGRGGSARCGRGESGRGAAGEAGDGKQRLPEGTSGLKDKRAQFSFQIKGKTVANER